MIRVGILGLGKMGKLHFMNALHTKDVQVVAIADKQKRNLKMANAFNVHTYSDYRTLMDSEDLDAVIISLPNFLKEKSIAHACGRNVGIFVDKPLARNLTEAKNIVQRVRANGIRLMVGANYRYIDSVQKLKKIVDEGRIGDVVIATAELVMNGPFSHPLVPKPVPEWWFDRELTGGGALLDLGYHLIDIFQWIFGDLDPIYSTLQYRYNMPLEDSATVVLESRTTGTRIVLNLGWFSKMVFPDFNFRINVHGTVGYACTDQLAPQNLYLNAVKEGVLNFLRRISWKKIHLLSYTYYYASFAEILEHFFDSIRDDSAFPISLEDQLKVVGLIEDIYKQNGVAANG